MDDVLNKSAKLPPCKQNRSPKDNKAGKFNVRNLAHKKEFAMTGNFAGSPTAKGQDQFKAAAALHNSEYGTFNKDGKLKPVGDLSDDQQTPDELQSLDKSQNRRHFNPDATNMDESAMASMMQEKVKRPRRLKSLPKHSK